MADQDLVRGCLHSALWIQSVHLLTFQPEYRIQVLLAVPGNRVGIE